jgi:hypothetical protein
MKLPKRLIEDAVLEAWPKIVRQWESVRGPNEMQRFLAISRKIMHDTAVDLLRHYDRHRSASLQDLPAEPISMAQTTYWGAVTPDAGEVLGPDW